MALLVGLIDVLLYPQNLIEAASVALLSLLHFSSTF